MKKLISCLAFLLIGFYTQAQDDYVIEEPINSSNNYEQQNTDFTNYSISSSALTLNKNNFQLLGTDLIYLKGSVGITENTMLSINLSLLGTYIGSIKHRIPISDDFNIAFSACGGNALQTHPDTIIRFGGGQFVSTVGDKQNNLSFGIGLYYGKSSFDLANDSRNLFFHNVFFATQKQLKRKTYIVAEVIYLWNYNTFMGSAAVKFLIKRKMSLHLGLMPLYRNGRIRQNQTVSEGTVIPMISYRWLFNQ